MPIDGDKERMIAQSRSILWRTVGELEARGRQAPSLGAAQRTKLADLVAEIKAFRPSSFDLYDPDGEEGFRLAVQDLAIQLRVLAFPILSARNQDMLQAVPADPKDLTSVAEALTVVRSLVPFVEDALASEQSGLLPEAMEQLLRSRKLDTVREAIVRAVDDVDADPPSAVTAARSAIESLLKSYLEDSDLDCPGKIGKQVKVALDDFLPSEPRAADEDVRKVLGGLATIVHGVAALRSHAGSAHGQGRRPYKLESRHARLALHAAQTFIEFFVEAWNHWRPNSESE